MTLTELQQHVKPYIDRRCVIVLVTFEGLNQATSERDLLYAPGIPYTITGVWCNLESDTVYVKINCIHLPYAPEFQRYKFYHTQEFIALCGI